MEAIIAQYIGSQKPNTRKRYALALREYMDFLEKKFGRRTFQNIKRATTQEARAFFKYISGKEGVPSRNNPADILAANSTIGNKIWLLRRLHEVLVIEGLLVRNIFKTHLINLPDERARMKRQTEIIPEGAIQNLLTLGENKPQERQLQCLMKLLLAGGLRLSEALSLTLGDVRGLSTPYPYLYLKETKCGHDTEHRIASWCRGILRSQIKERESEGANIADRLFVSYSVTGKLLRPEYLFRSASRHIKKALTKAGISQCSSHSFRKTFANKIADSEVDVRKIRAALRHSSLWMTERYLQMRVPFENSAVESANFFS